MPTPGRLLDTLAGGATPDVRIDGAADLAGEMHWLVDNLRWDIEGDLAQALGPTPARAVMSIGRAGARALRRMFAAASPGPSQPGSAAAMRQLARALFIALTLLRFGIDDIALSGLKQRWVRALARLATFGRNLREPRGVRLRRAFERLGPIFVKFGQVLSTRRDLLPPDIADELAKLQDRVPPFPGRARARWSSAPSAGRVDDVFSSFDAEPVASASIAQVHFAVLQGRPRSGGQGAAAGHAARRSTTIWRCWTGSRAGSSASAGRQAPEATRGGGRVRHAICTTNSIWCARPPTRRNCGATWRAWPLFGSRRCTGTGARANVMVMQRMSGIPISQIDRLTAAGVDIKRLARDGVTIFFTQVFRDGFFHADMHPGNILVGTDAAISAATSRWTSASSAR